MVIDATARAFVLKTSNPLQINDFYTFATAQHYYAAFSETGVLRALPVTHCNLTYIPKMEFNIMGIIKHMSVSAWDDLHSEHVTVADGRCLEHFTSSDVVFVVRV